MKTPSMLLLGATALAVAGCDGSPALGSPEKAFATSGAPVVVELFQSQGCSSCPPANANVNAIAGRPDVLALSFAVTYWDQLSWKDTFGSPAWTTRQWEYARRAGRNQVGTPEVIVNGTRDVTGIDGAQLAATIRGAGSPKGGPSVAVRRGSVILGPGPRGPAATVWLVGYDTRTLEVPVRAGENGGKTLPHRNVVRSLVRIGTWSGGATELRLPPRSPGLAGAILVQSGPGGRILSAARI